MVRKTLGQHDIPTRQTIGIDHAAGMLKRCQKPQRIYYNQLPRLRASAKGNRFGLAGLSRRGNRVGLHFSSGCRRCLRYNRQRWQLL
jgi:hypothetical protein